MYVECSHSIILDSIKNEEHVLQKKKGHRLLHVSCSSESVEPRESVEIMRRLPLEEAVFSRATFSERTCLQ